jgi:hypothetical protein
LASLQGTTIGSFGEKALCNGANLAQEIIIWKAEWFWRNDSSQAEMMFLLQKAIARFWLFIM